MSEKKVKAKASPKPRKAKAATPATKSTPPPQLAPKVSHLKSDVQRLSGMELATPSVAPQPLKKDDGQGLQLAAHRAVLAVPGFGKNWSAKMRISVNNDVVIYDVSHLAVQCRIRPRVLDSTYVVDYYAIQTPEVKKQLQDIVKASGLKVSKEGLFAQRGG